MVWCFGHRQCIWKWTLKQSRSRARQHYHLPLQLHIHHKHLLRQSAHCSVHFVYKNRVCTTVRVPRREQRRHDGRADWWVQDDPSMHLHQTTSRDLKRMQTKMARLDLTDFKPIPSLNIEIWGIPVSLVLGELAWRPSRYLDRHSLPINWHRTARRTVILHNSHWLSIIELLLAQSRLSLQ